jgi:hypothetical protein
MSIDLKEAVKPVSYIKTNAAEMGELEFARSIAAMQQESLRNGNSKMTLDEINTEIQAVRFERAQKQ